MFFFQAKVALFVGDWTRPQLRQLIRPEEEERAEKGGNEIQGRKQALEFVSSVWGGILSMSAVLNVRV